MREGLQWRFSHSADWHEQLDSLGCWGEGGGHKCDNVVEH